MSNEGETQGEANKNKEAEACQRAAPDAAEAREVPEENYRKALAHFLYEDPEKFLKDAEQIACKADTAQPDRRVQKLAAFWLLSVGSLVVIATIVFKFWFLGQLSCILPSELLLPSEFITGISLGTILVAFGAFLSLYQYKVRADSVRIHLRNRAEIIRRLADSASHRP
jgi:hypothetical protein